MRFVRYVAALAAIVLIWWILSALFGGGNILPDPVQAFSAFGASLGTPMFWNHLAASSGRVLLSMALAWAAAFPLGIVMGSSRKVDAWLAPFVFVTYPVPKIVLLPVVLLLFGLGNLSKVLLISLILGYQVLVAVRDGVANLNPRYLDSVRSLGAGRLDLFREVLVPAALPHGFTALRLGTGTSVAVLFFVESFATTRGLGYLIMDAWGRLDYRDMFVGILGMSLLGAALFEAVNGLEHVLCRWRRARIR
ncbi:NitT/TauT family transport system permease protein [Desulfacinum infernum DSM 9756]|uniref:NitT/TauT family transport system permease protein n=1 Tax=Desulfacinum infernum DSM 9756 TaxID=1121391 RepID=A0A1M5I393_9BACT|nr:ABC transporter permease [Desulfacinum infernum]SHG22774.1 NitT/TauT family transport system permease protein [Desulfacinum infernum DSM 9756]